MHIRTIPDMLTKLTQMGDMTLYEPAGDQPHTEKAQSGHYQSHSIEECISHVSTPMGKKAILKTMVTTACERNCFYCPFRAGRGKTQRVTFSPDNLAAAFNTLQQANKVDGMFLSSGIIKGGITTQDKIIDTAEIVRKKYGYRGYIHLKIMPGSEYDQVYRAMQLADRISINLEAPTQERLNALAPKKQFADELLQMLKWAEDIRRQNPHRKLANSVTQFVVGAVGDTDLELLSVSSQLYAQMSLKRVYYSAFHPIVQTPFENLVAVNPKREHRLYQASFLLRDYGWNVEELSFQERGIDSGNLRLDIDPKRAWAEANLRYAPIDLMIADREQLMRIPGIGLKGAAAILKARTQGKITDLMDLRKLGIAAPQNAAPYVLLDGHRPLVQGHLF